jgi:hypothetical protein
LGLGLAEYGTGFHRWKPLTLKVGFLTTSQTQSKPVKPKNISEVKPDAKPDIAVLKKLCRLFVPDKRGYLTLCEAM